jgi:hypothetical protein
VIVHRVDTDRPDVSIENREIGTLLWLILAAAGETEIGEAPTIESAPGVRLTSDNLQETLAGSTIRGPDFVVSFSQDGTAAISAAGEWIDTGQWWTEGDKLCLQWEQLDGGEIGCVFFVLDDTTIKWFDLNGTLAGKGLYRRE